jgi:hypothetical protein
MNLSTLRIRILVRGIAAVVLAGFIAFMWHKARESKPVDAEVTKWMDNHKAAISLTYDGYPESNPSIIEMVKERKLTMDFEFISGSLTEQRVQYYKDVLLRQGFGLFGHGHEHENHDRKGPEWAFRSAKSCFEIMSILGVNPVAFAYPGGHGGRRETHDAMRRAGFLSARGHDITSKPYILASDKQQSVRWYKLPDVFMESINYRNQKGAVNNTDDLERFLEGALSRTAWIILTYHAIGLTGRFGFYEKEYFATDLDAIAKRDFWVASMNNVTLYIYEREKITVKATQYANWRGNPEYITIKIDDGLPDARFDQPLTVRFSIPRSWVGRKLLYSPDNLSIRTARSESSTAMVNLVPTGNVYTIRPDAKESNKK